MLKDSDWKCNDYLHLPMASVYSFVFTIWRKERINCQVLHANAPFQGRGLLNSKLMLIGEVLANWQI